jgi:PKD repeat protein
LELDWSVACWGTVAVARAPNSPPIADAGGDYSSTEGASLVFSANGSIDPEGGPLTYTWDFGDGTNGNGPSPSHVYPDNGRYQVELVVTDPEGATSRDTTTVGVVNVAPVISSLRAPSGPIQLTLGSAQATITIDFVDPAGNHDAFNALVRCGNGTTLTLGPVISPLTASCVYTAPGVYTVGAAISDEDGGFSPERLVQYVVVFDPAAGFVNGNGSILSPPGAYSADPTRVGTTTFSLLSRYQKGATVPSGNTDIQFTAGTLSFRSTAYEWLVVTGARAQFKGSGTVNGAGDYGFLISVVDGQMAGGGGVDRFRIKIWNRGSGSVIYDSQMGVADDAEAATALQDGTIAIRVK